MEPTAITEPTGFGQLSKVDQIRYLLALWDRIAENPGDIPVSEAHIRLAEGRLADFRKDPTRAQPARDVLDRLSKKDH